MEHTIALTEEQVDQVLASILDAQELLSDKLLRGEEHGEFDGEEMEILRDNHATYEELYGDILVSLGRAKKFSDHFELAKNEEDNWIVTDYPEDLEDYSDEVLHHVWTIVARDYGLGIAPGFHLEDKLQHVVSTQPWTDADSTTFWVYP